jgi:phospholipid-binding lipoprotein MlaA
LRPSILPVIVLAALAAPACGWARAVRDQPATPGDPWETFNRRNFALNQKVDRALIRPLARLTSGLTPGPIGRGVRNFLVNLNEPVVILNDLLQIRPGRAFGSTFRLVVNTTVGVLGALDVAKALGVPMHVNGFGDTLGRWGAGPGPYLVLPVLGPGDVRDLAGSAVDDATLPLQTVSYPYRTAVTLSVALVGGLNQREAVAKDYEALLAGATDPYATLRSTYLQSREAQIRGAKALPVLPDIEDTPAAPAPQAQPPASPPPAAATPPPADPTPSAAPRPPDQPGPRDGSATPRDSMEGLF